MTWRDALAEFVDGEDEGFLNLRHDETGDLLSISPLDWPTPAELIQIYAGGWRVDRAK